MASIHMADSFDIPYYETANGDISKSSELAQEHCSLSDVLIDSDEFWASLGA